MAAIRRPAVLAVWALAVAILGGLAVARHDDSHVRTGAASSTTTTTLATGATAALPGATDPAAPGSGDTVPAGGDATVPGDGGGGEGGTVDPGPGAVVPADRTMPLPGTYTMTTFPGASASINGKPQPVPPETQLVIEQVSDTDQKLTSASGSGGSAVQLRYTATEVSLVSMVFGPKAFQPDPPATFAPTGAPTGTTWQWSCASTDGKTNMAAQGRIVGTETLTVAGQAVDTVIVDLVLTLTGDVSGTIHITTWARPSDKLPVRQHSVVDVGDPTKIVFHLQSDATSQLVDLSPT